MLRALSLYAFINAKVRAMFSFLLSLEQCEALTRAPRPEDFFQLLGATPYREIVARPEVASDPRLLEKTRRFYSSILAVALFVLALSVMIIYLRDPFFSY